MEFLKDIRKPTLLLDVSKCRANIRLMAAKARQNGLAFRPHFKTHQSRTIGAWFRDNGVEAIAVSSLSMAEYFAADGWDDITVAFPVNLREIAEIRALARRIRLNLLVADSETARILDQSLNEPCGFFLKIDTGYHRTGLPAGEIKGITNVLRQIRNPRLAFRGFLTHAGHTYGAGSAAEVIRIHRRSVRQLVRLKKNFAAQYPGLIVSLGDTPACSIADDFPGVDEIRPGNFVFYDVMQEQLGACEFDQIAVCLACPIVTKDRGRREMLIYGGAVHLSKEFLAGPAGGRQYGRVVALRNRSWSRPVPQTYVSHLSQEHGIIRTDLRGFQQFAIGDVIGVLPVHSCLTADLMRGYITLQGDRIDYRPR